MLRYGFISIYFTASQPRVTPPYLPPAFPPLKAAFPVTVTRVFLQLASQAEAQRVEAGERCERPSFLVRGFSLLSQPATAETEDTDDISIFFNREVKTVRYIFSVGGEIRRVRGYVTDSSLHFQAL
jgi:hypothetical protein